MAKFKHEITNRKVLATKEYTKSDWRMITCVYPKKCEVCKQWIDKNTKVLWHIKSKLLMHEDCI